MCEIQFMYKFGNKKNNYLTKNDIKAFMNLMDMGSYANADAYGIFGNNYLFRKAGSFHAETTDIRAEMERNMYLAKSNFLVGHNRWATKGDKNKNFNNHPFPTQDWVIVHNGVLSNDVELQTKHNLDYKEETDSVIAVKLLQKFTDMGYKSVDALKMVAEELLGSFSICALNKKENRLFYFKNTSPSFAFRLFKMSDGTEVLTGSTGETNLDKIYVNSYMIFDTAQYDTYMHSEAYPCCIYEITKSKIEIVEYFTEKKYVAQSYYGKKYSHESSQTKSQKFVTTGGIYKQDWETGWSDWKNNKNAKDLDIDLMDSEKFHSNFEFLDLDSLDENAMQLNEELIETTGQNWDYEINWNTGLVCYSINDCPISSNDIRELIKEKIGIVPSFGFNKGSGITTLNIDIKEVNELYK